MTGIDPQSIFDAFINKATVDPNNNFITGVTRAEIEPITSGLVAGVTDLIENSLPQGTTVGEVFGALGNTDAPLSILPASFPGKVLVIGSRTAKLPSSSRHKITLQITDEQGFTEWIRFEKSTAEIAGKRITLGYIPATANDVATIASFDGLYKVPPYLVNLRPVLYVDGQPTGSGGAVPMGTTQKVKVSFKEPTGQRDSVEHLITAGTFAALGLDVQRVTPEFLESRKAKLAATKDLLGVEGVNLDDFVGETLYIHGLAYFAMKGTFSSLLSNQFNSVTAKRPSELLVTFAPTFSFLFNNVALSVKNLGFTIDVRRDIASVSSRVGNSDIESSYVLGAGVIGSVMEHSIFELMQGIESFSAAKAISLASERGIPIFMISATNIDSVLSQINASSAILADVRNTVNAGRQVLIPQRNISVLDFDGTGYIVMDPETGAAAFNISGGLAGGATTSVSGMGQSFEDGINDASIGFSIGEFIAILLNLDDLSGGLGKLNTFLSVITSVIESLMVFENTENVGIAILYLITALSLLFAIALFASVFSASGASFILVFAWSLIVGIMISILLKNIREFLLSMSTAIIRFVRNFSPGRLPPSGIINMSG